jgi:hypothetical protein
MLAVHGLSILYTLTFAGARRSVDISDLTGIHISWVYLPLSLILGVMAVGLGYMDQLPLFFVLIPIAVIAVWWVAKRRLGGTIGP